MKKVFLTALCAACLVAVSVFGTLAYLTDKDQAVNTFTVGKVDIDLDETDVDTDGKPTNKERERDKANEYHLIPGQTYTKDPTVTVKKGSEASYIYMIVTVENMDQLKLALPESITDETGSIYYQNGIFLIQNLCDWPADSPWQYKGYREYKENVNEKEIYMGEYRFVYEDIVAGDASGEKALPALFNTITVPGEHITSDTIKYLSSEVQEEDGVKKGGVKICVDAYAVQAAGFEDYNKAWDAAAFEGYDSDENYDISVTP